MSEQPVGLSRQELLRKVVHIAVGGIALAVVFLGPLYSTLCAVAALCSNLFLLPRVGGKKLWREDELSRGASLGIVFYPAAVLGLILVFWQRLEVAAAIWGLLALGDGMAPLIGKTVGGPRLPWNPNKTVAGSLAYWLFGALGIAGLAIWTLHHQGNQPDWLFLGTIALATALLGAAVESLPLGLDDNLSVPLLTAPTFYCLLETAPFWSQLDLAAYAWPLGVGVCVNTAFGLAAYRLRSIDGSGLFAGILLGTLIWTCLGWQGWLLLLAFFVLGTGATKLGYARKAALGLAQSKGGRRSARHAVANSGVAAFCAFFATSWPAEAQVFAVAFAGAFATAAGDTLASEIGQLWGRRTFLITSLRPVPRGTDGAISLEGTLAGGLGSLLVAALGAAVGLYPPTAVLAITLAGVSGSLLESVVGATLEKRGLLDNEAVNFLNTLTGAALAALFLKISL